MSRDHEFCTHTAGASRCVRKPGHEPPHLFRCAGRWCPGLPWTASNVPHPSSCEIEGMLTDVERDAVERLRRGEPIE